MSPTLEITVPKTALLNEPKPHTVYEISLRLPLRSFTLQKRYSEFATLHDHLRSQTGRVPPAPLPPKHFFSSTLRNASLAESRRAGLETYLRAISESPDPAWRETTAWRSFLNLPSNLSSKSSTAGATRAVAADGKNAAGASDPAAWLDLHRDLQAALHEARLHVTARDRAGNVGASHEEAAEAKKALVRAGAMIASLDSGLKARQEEWGRERLGEGEVRRRRDLIATAGKDRDGLEKLLAAMAKKEELDATVERQRAPDGFRGKSLAGGGNGGKKVRVLGKETARTRELDNKGVLDLQTQTMREQDEDIDAIGETVKRQKDLALQINEELARQLETLGMLDEDVTRLDGKTRAAAKKIGKLG